ncbi:glycosyl hydrolase [Roseivirga pacifica]|uniref:glycosyl hydrolase n=1 Tax=Roseivirga pacifica TaxID=1267423 RepID=UPI0020964A04|nr:glycosyl hydrolase [Roseivirga pacifica]MCO6368364.1 glycosyl hydrolase [Roseivirga pacifica]MCO6372506.1 glycosyl hydrolase [Roseivirga pacifica]MCO6376564.1 glycosyl hydrolase [Roseivirga pacifica]MCO6378156.1 glycosyl hydrolase [Roseivirga pacifica]
MKLIAGTDKGLLVYSQKSNGWKLADIHFIGLPIGAFHQDVTGQWWVAINHKHWGTKLYRSADQGESFKEIPAPKFAKGTHSLKSVWTIESRLTEGKLELFIGVEPAAIFVSKDNGDSFSELSGLSEHPSRETWQGGGKGSKSPFLHSILFHPEKPNQLMVGISCAGVFQSDDFGNTWQATNSGLKSFFLPDSTIDVGHDPHSMLRHPKNPDVIWQQNHCGIYRSPDDGHTWADVSDPEAKAVYGFDLVIDESDIDTAWVIPAQSDDLRIPHNTELAVYKTVNAGQSWQPLTKGLPPKGSFDLVLRDGFDKRGQVMVFGTNNGNLYTSSDLGENWQAISQSLSAVRVVKLLG